MNADGKIDYQIISNNGDRDKIIATVYQTIVIYLKRYPNKIIYFKGSTKERTRLYRMIINNNFKHFDFQYDIWAEVENDLFLSDLIFRLLVL